MPVVFPGMIFIKPVSTITVRPVSGLIDPGYRRGFLLTRYTGRFWLSYNYKFNNHKICLIFENMNPTKTVMRILKYFIICFFLSHCNTDNYSNISSLDREPVIEPDYSGVTIPWNIAPMNFIIREDGDFFKVRVKSSNGLTIEMNSKSGIVRIPKKSWRKILSANRGGKIEIYVISEDNEGKFIRFNPFYINISNESVDPYLCYRLLYPGYEFWRELKIEQRSTESFRKKSVVENQLLNDNCINCHSFSRNDPDKLLLHVRGSVGGTYFFDGKDLIRRDLQAGEMTANAVYPSWHPSGNYVAFSSNKTVQSFHMRPEKNIDVYDLYSSLVVYDTRSNEISFCGMKDSLYMETFPYWSPDGNLLYYCRTDQVGENFDIKNVKYDLVRKSFNQESGTFGNTEIVFNAREIGKSISFPTVSPDGQYLIFTLQDYGTFPIWNREADLYLMDLKNLKADKMSLNSNETESYHSWSSNGKWIVFSSKRGDGLTARPYIAFFDSPDSVGKPFVLPQKDPAIYARMEKTFNRPEFVKGQIKTGPRDFARASKKESVKALWANNRK
ncbi:MAG TPA: cytochrome C biosynthesis protein [Bacteroidales bacterium]|nr:cytochrome C biosynthesis protein [Bacteroidales bacterium]